MSSRSSGTSVTVGAGMGAVLAAIISFSCNHSILWAILHFIFGWFYVIYRAIIGGY